MRGREGRWAAFRGFNLSGGEKEETGIDEKKKAGREEGREFLLSLTKRKEKEKKKKKREKKKKKKESQKKRIV